MAQQLEINKLSWRVRFYLLTRVTVTAYFESSNMYNLTKYAFTEWALKN